LYILLIPACFVTLSVKLPMSVACERIFTKFLYRGQHRVNTLYMKVEEKFREPREGIP